jgi:hypothetical protein
MAILVVVDGTQFTQYALDFVCRFTSPTDNLILVHGYESVNESQLLVPGELSPVNCCR